MSGRGWVQLELIDKQHLLLAVDDVCYVREEPPAAVNLCPICTLSLREVAGVPIRATTFRVKGTVTEILDKLLAAEVEYHRLLTTHF